MGNEEFIISSIKSEDEYVIVAFSVSNMEERMSRLIDIAEKRWNKRYGNNVPLPVQYKQQIIGGGIPPIVMRLPLSQWNTLQIGLNDKVVMNVPEGVQDITPVRSQDFGI